MYTSLECETADYLTDLMDGKGSARRRFRSGNSSLRRSSLFSLYARIFRLLLGKWERGALEEETERDEYGHELDCLVLPSNEEWRLKVYYRLVELQRENDAELAKKILEESRRLSAGRMEEAQRAPRQRQRVRRASRGQRWDWEPDSRVSYPLMARSSRRLSALDSTSSVMLDDCPEPGWRLRDILLAARLLKDERPKVQYADEAEMRRVFGLVYDVLRYKQILDRALDDVGFWQRYGQLKDRQRIVWLLLYDLQGRKFARGGGSEAMMARTDAFTDDGLIDIDRALYAMKTRLAASLSRLRIGGSALSLDELLPPHLRTAEGVTWGEQGAIASGWVNSAKLRSRQIFIEEMEKLGMRLCRECSDANELEEHEFVFDPLCPKVVNLHEKSRERLAVSRLVRENCFVFMERSLCVGAAALVHAVRSCKLCGPVILTHSLAPRHTGYLAELLADVEDVGRLLAFGVGENRAEHQAYLEKLGIPIQRCKLFSERYTSSPHSAEIERATMVLATPPSSFTGVRDVVDLAIARGGDLSLLESLTSLDAESPQQPRALLAEQMSTLRHALTRPNVQLLVYEVHTLLPCETTEMIGQAVDHANRLAIDKYHRDHPQRKKSPPRESTTKKTKSSKRSQSVEGIAKEGKDESKSNAESQDESHSNELQIPESDLFEMLDLNDLYEQDCSCIVDPGSFIMMVKRKEMMQFDSLFMIKVAEAKGVFGDPNKQPQSKTPEPQLAALMPDANRRKSQKKKIQFERITAPTHASIMRASTRARHACGRYQHRLSLEESALDAQKSSRPSFEPITPMSSPKIRNPPADLHIELTDITNLNEEKKKSANLIQEKNAYLKQKLQSLHMDIDDMTEDGEAMKTDDTENTCFNDDDQSDRKSPPECTFINRSIDGTSLVKNPYSEAQPLREFLEKNVQSLLALRPSQFARKRPLPHPKTSRLRRIPFQSRLETVHEQSQVFSYLFPEEQ